MAVGKIETFDPVTGNWRLYSERLEQYFLINDVKENLKVPTLITVMGSQAYELLVTLCAPRKPTTMSFTDLVKIMLNFLQPKPSILAERYKFRQRKQKSGESIAEYVTALKGMAMTCDFKSGIDENLRDQLVCGLLCETVRQKLFAEGEIDFQKAFTLATALEAAEKDAAEVNDGGSRQDSGFFTSGKLFYSERLQRDKRSKGMSQEQLMRADASTSRGSSLAGGRGRGRVTSARAGGGGRPGASAGMSPVGASSGAGAQLAACRVCGGLHEPITCRFRFYVCRICNSQGHLKRMCPKVPKVGHNYVSELINNEEETDSDEGDTM